MGQSLSDLGAASKKRVGEERKQEMREAGIKFPKPDEVLTEVPDFDNAGLAMLWSRELTPKQLKEIKDIPFRVGGRMPLTITQRLNLSPMNHDSLTQLTSSGAIQQVFKVVKDPSGLTEWVGAKRGGEMKMHSMSSRHSKRF